MEAYLDYQKGGTGGKLNDIIEDFKYVYKGQSVKAGDFVNYINGVAGVVDYGTSTDTAVESANSNSGYVISAVALDDSRVFIAHSRGSTLQLYGVVCTINGAKITKGADTEINGNGYSGYAISAVALDSTRVFIAHSSDSTAVSSRYLKGIVCTISGTTITKGTDTQLVSGSYTGYYLSAIKLEENKVFIAHTSGNSDYLYGLACTIEGTTITGGTDTKIVASAYAGHMFSTCLLSNGNVFISHEFGSSSYALRAIVVSISGTTITLGGDTVLSSTAYSGFQNSACLLTDGRVFVAHSYSSSYSLYGMICTISDKTITVGTDTALIAEREKGGYRIATAALEDNNVFIFCSSEEASASKMYLHGMIATILGATITVGADTQLSTTSTTAFAISPLLLNNGNIFVAHSYSTDYYLYAQIWGVDETNNIPTNHITATGHETQVTPATESPFNAIALSSGEGGTDTEHKDQVKIARVYKEITKEGNMFPTTWEQVTAGTKYSSADGYVIETDSFASSSNYAKFAVDNDTSTSWQSVNGVKNFYIKMTCPMPKKITKMKVRFNIDGSNNVSYIRIQGSKDGETWNDVYYTTSNLTALTEVTLKNTDYYKYYKIVGYPQQTGAFYVYEWQTSEYVEVIT